ncbi:MAG: zinc ribbon domain-containing protein [Deltaproteobacteria bacterium]|jgi:flagellar basal body P-ring protein FlgI|nr:zinc ribbon domain-containing protein [Deltaproteobacteria bacterium]
MPTYTYRHLSESPGCDRAPCFEWEQVARDLPLTVCPFCGVPVERELSPSMIKKRNFDCELRDKGFTKLVRVDDGIFENVTRRPGEAKYVDRRKPETLPILEKTIKD